MRALIQIQMIDTKAGWALIAGTDSITLLRTTDGGSHWKAVAPRSPSGRDVAVFKVSALTSLIAWAIPAGTIPVTPNTQIFHTVDGGGTWRHSTIPVPSVAAINFLNSQDGWLVASLAAYMGDDEVEIYRSTDGGETWIKVASATRESETSGLPVSGGKAGITFLNPTTGWITGATLGPEWIYLYMTRDGGRTWRQQDLPLPPHVTAPWYCLTNSPMFFTAQDGVLPVFYNVAEPTTYRTIASVGVLYGTHDGGATWTYGTPVPSGNGPLSFPDIHHGLITDGQLLHVTSDGGHHWTTLRPGTPFSEIKQLDFASPNVGWALREGSPALLKSVDGGRTWALVAYTIVRR